MEKFHMCLLKKDMEVIKSAQLSYAGYSVPIALSQAALTEAGGILFEAEERAGGRPLCLESPLLCLVLPVGTRQYRRGLGFPVGTRQYRSGLGFPVLPSTDGAVSAGCCRRHLWHSFVFITCWCILMKTELICFSRKASRALTQPTNQ